MLGLRRNIFLQLRRYKSCGAGGQKMKQFIVYRYNPGPPEKGPCMQTFTMDVTKCGRMVLDALMYIKAHIDPTLSFRRSCREGICGSCSMNIGGLNCLACTTPIPEKAKSIKIYPLPHMYVLRDLVVDQTHFFDQYRHIQPWLKRPDLPSPENQQKKRGCMTGKKSGQPLIILQSEKDREKLNGLVDCILCGCCTAACPPYWWNYKRFLGPAVLMQAHRWVIDSRDKATEERLKMLKDYFSVYRCHTIFNCTSTCPKGLNPGRSVAKLKRMLIGLEKKSTPDMESAEPFKPQAVGSGKSKVC